MSLEELPNGGCILEAERREARMPAPSLDLQDAGGGIRFLPVGRPRGCMTLGRAWAQPGPAAHLQEEAEGGRRLGLGPQTGRAGEARVGREQRKGAGGYRWG